MVTLRSAGEADVPPLTALERDAFGPDAWSATAVAAELTGPGRTSVVAEDDAGVLVGYAVTRTAGDVADLQRVVVAESARRAGVATTLLTHLAACAAGEGARRLLLEVSEVNAAAVACYRRLGFVEIDRRRRYYRDGTDALVMQRELEGVPR